MKVTLDQLGNTAIYRMTVTEGEKPGVHTGSVVGYWCSECHQADETLEQIWHNEDCSYAGEHGRDTYGHDHSFCTLPRGELCGSTLFDMIKCADTYYQFDMHNGNVIGFRCRHCHNMDEHLFQILHDENCVLVERSEKAKHVAH